MWIGSLKESKEELRQKIKDYYLLLVSEKAQPPNIIHKLNSDFNFTTQQLKEISLPHLVALESYVEAFQCKFRKSVEISSIVW